MAERKNHFMKGFTKVMELVTQGISVKLKKKMLKSIQYELFRRILGLGSTHRIWRVLSQPYRLWDVVTRSVLDTGMSLLVLC